MTLIGISIDCGGRRAEVTSAVFEEKGGRIEGAGTDIVVSNMSTSLTPKPFSASVLDRISTLPMSRRHVLSLVELMSMRTPR